MFYGICYNIAWLSFITFNGVICPQLMLVCVFIKKLKKNSEFEQDLWLHTLSINPLENHSFYIGINNWLY